MITVIITSKARCKHCKFAKQGTFLKQNGEQSKKLISVCNNPASKFNNIRISQRDIACENIEIV